MPADVQDFIVTYRNCEHWLGEPDWDAERRRQIEQVVAGACPGVDALAERVRRRYAANPDVLARLRDYEPLGQ